MSIQIDIADVISEVGIAFTIARMNVEVPNVTEYLTYTPNSQVTKPFVREHFLEVAYKSDTVVLPGDVITFVVSGDSYLVVNNTPDFFENEIIRYLSVLYKVNVVIDLLRPHKDFSSYNTEFSFQAVASGIPLLIYAPLFGNTSGVDFDAGAYNVSKHDMYIPVGYNAHVGDRVYIPDTSEVFQITTIIPRRFPNIDVCMLSEDTR